MDNGPLFWQVLLIVAIGLFGVLAIALTVGGFFDVRGFFDIRALFKNVAAQHESEHGPEGPNAA